MYPITNTVKALFDAEQNKILRITGTDKNGTAISITDADVIIGGFSVDRYCCNGEKLEIGTAIAGELNLTLNNSGGAFDSIIFEGAELFVEIGIADWTQETPSVTYIPIGYFTPDQQPRRLTTISIKALDRMTRFDAVHPTLTPWTDNNGNQMTDGNGDVIYFCAELAFPCTVANLVEQCCIRCEVPFDQSLSSLPNYNYTLNGLPDLQQDITFRQIIQWCAGMMGTCAIIDWNGKLIFKWYSAASYITTTANRFQSDLYENDLTITGVQYTNTQGVNIVSGEPTYALDMTGNYLAASGIATILPAVNTALNGFSYRPFTATVIAAPYLWPLDVITFTDKDGNNHNCALTNVNFGLNGATVIESKGMTAQLNSAVAPAAVTSDEARLIEGAVEATKQLDESLDQEGVFNRLTDNGEVQGLYLYNGKVYLNASYIQTGEMVADRIKGGTLTLGGEDDVNGKMEVLDSGGNLVCEIDNSGTTINRGTITNYSADGYRRVIVSSGQIQLQEYDLGYWNDKIRINTTNGANSIGSQTGLYLSGTTIGDTTYINLTDGSTDTKVEICASVSGGPGCIVRVGYDEFSVYHNAKYMRFDSNNGLVAYKLSAENGASGTFTTADNKNVTVTNGIITSIV